MRLVVFSQRKRARAIVIICNTGQGTEEQQNKTADITDRNSTARGAGWGRVG